MAGGTAGAIASAIANPSDLMKVRLQTDGMAKDEAGKLLPKRYTGMVNCFMTIVKEEGVLALWTVRWLAFVRVRVGPGLGLGLGFGLVLGRVTAIIEEEGVPALWTVRWPAAGRCPAPARHGREEEAANPNPSPSLAPDPRAA